MIVFSQADGTITNVAITPVYQGSNLDGSIYFVAPLARRNTVNLAFKLPSGKFTDMYNMTAVDAVEGLSEEFSDKWTIWQWAYGNAEVTEFAGPVTAQFIVSLPNGNVLTTASTSFEVLPGIKPNPPENPSDSVYAYITSYLSIIDDRTKNVPNLVAKIQKVASNAFTYTNNSNVESAPIVFTGGEEAPMPVTPASTIIIEKDADGWQPIYESDQTTISGYKYEVDAALHGQMRDDATPNDLWVSFSAQDSNAFDGKYADYTVDDEGNITVTVSEPVELTVRVWNGKGLVDNVARADIQAETERAETTESNLQKQIDEIVLSGVDKTAREDIAAEAERAEAAEQQLQQNIEAEQTRAESAESALSSRIDTNAADISGLREDIANESHFRGIFNNVEELRAAYPTATPNDYAWIAGGNIWIWQDGEWEDSEVPVPSTAVPASTSTPLMDGVASVGTANSYARGDHRHPEKPVDSELSATSENPVQNKVVANALNQKVDNVTYATNSAGMQNAINQLKASTLLCTCSTDGFTSEKIVTIPTGTSFTLTTGVTIKVQFTYTNSSPIPSLNVNSTGAKQIYFPGLTTSSKNVLQAGRILEFIYDGTNWIMLSGNTLDAYPIGSVYISTAKTKPAEIFGGAWTQLTDRFLIGAGGSYSVDATGGETTHTLTINEMPSHSHSISTYLYATGSNRKWASGSGDASAEYRQTDATGGGAAHNNMPPYLAVYMWKRTA